MNTTTNSQPRRAGISAATVVMLVAIFPAMLLARGAWASEPTTGSMRCGTHLVYVGDPKYEVLNRCGEPDSASLVGERLRRLAVPHGPLHYSTESLVPVEEWIYERGYGQFIRILTFEGDTLERIRLGPRQ